MTTPAIASKLASALRLHGVCTCHSKSLWPWKRDAQCGMCAALEAFDKAKASHEIVQKEGVAGFVQQHPGGKSSL